MLCPPAAKKADTLGAFITITVIILSFFSIHKLYSYHIIYSTKRHIANILQALTWSTIAILITYGLYNIQALSLDNIFLLTILLISIALIIASRLFLENILNNIVFSTGLALLLIGTLEMIAQDRILIFINHWNNLILTMLSICIPLIIYRYITVAFIFNKILRRHFRRQILFIGVDDTAKRIAKKLIRHNAPFWVSGFLCDKNADNTHLIEGKPKLGSTEDLNRVIPDHDINEIIITNKDIDKTTLVTILEHCTQQGVTVWFPPEYMPVLSTKLKTDSFCGFPMIRLCERNRLWLSFGLKYIMDFALASMLMLVLSPLFALIAIIIKLTSPGPVFYRATVYGQNAKLFTMYKFRSMYINANNNIHKDYVHKFIRGEIRSGSEKSEEPFKIKDDPRVTSIGKWLRKLSIDELPQLINVIKGDMSLVGPRPCLPYEYELYRDWHKKRLSVRPGITGLWQVAGRSSVPFEDMILLDLYYIYNMSIFLDLNIMYETIFVVILKKGAY